MSEQRYENILGLVYGQPWAITQDYMNIISAIVSRRAAGIELSQGEIDAAVGQRRPAPPQPGGVAVMALHGPIMQRANLMSEMSGGTSAHMFGLDYARAMADPNVGSIVIDVDSPGGSVFGIQELHDVMMSYRGVKPVTAVANSMAASAAYWIASAADSISVTPGGMVGSIGVIQQHDDLSGAMEQGGVKTTLITAGKKKASGHPFGPLDAESLSDAQAKVNTYYSMFVNAVAKGRGVSASAVRAGYGEGDVVMAQEAKRLGMVDRIETLAQAIGRMGGGRQRNGARAEGGLVMTPEMAKMMTSAALACGVPVPPSLAEFNEVFNSDTLPPMAPDMGGGEVDWIVGPSAYDRQQLMLAELTRNGARADSFVLANKQLIDDGLLSEEDMRDAVRDTPILDFKRRVTPQPVPSPEPVPAGSMSHTRSMSSLEMVDGKLQAVDIEEPRFDTDEEAAAYNDNVNKLIERRKYLLTLQ